MLKTKKKGFTIVELVIVIAVIAILAAVLIPTFATVIKNAEKSTAMQACKSAYSEYLSDYGKGKVVNMKGVTLFYINGSTKYKFVCNTTTGQFDGTGEAVDDVSGTVDKTYSDGKVSVVDNNRS